MSEQTTLPKDEAASSPTPEQLFKAAASAMSEGDALIGRSGKDTLKALQCFDRALSILASPSLEASDRRSHLTGWAWMNKGNAFLSSNTSEGIERALSAYQAALNNFQAIREKSKDHLADLAALWSNIGHAQFRVGSPERTFESEKCYRQAIELLSKTDWEENPRCRHNLSACWLNIGNVLVRLQQKPDLEPATEEAFAKAIELAEGLPEKDLGSIVAKAAIHSNLAKALQRSKNRAQLEKALQEFSHAIALLEVTPIKKDLRLRLELASALVNRAALQLRIANKNEQIQGILQDSEIALQLSNTDEKENLLAAEVSTLARRTLTQMLGMVMASQPEKAQREIHDKCSDLIEEGLELISAWESRGANSLRLNARHLFHIGCAFYRVQQPQFLVEFITEHLHETNPDLTMVKTAHKALLDGLKQTREQTFVDLDDPKTEQVVAMAKAMEKQIEKLKPFLDSPEAAATEAPEDSPEGA